MVRRELKFAELTGKIIGCAMRVHSAIGPGFPEIIYKRCLMIELSKEGLSFVSEMEKEIFYDGIWVGKRRIDLFVEGKVYAELKAVTEVDKKYYNQVLNCLRVFQIEVGLLLNFGNESLEFKRFINSISEKK